MGLVDLENQIDQDWYYGVTLALSDSQAEITKYENPTIDQ